MSGSREQGTQPVPGHRHEDPEEPDAAPRGTGPGDSLRTDRFHNGDDVPIAAEEQEVEVIVLSPRTLMAPTRFASEVRGRGLFQREQNLQLHRRGRAHAPARDDPRRLLPRRKRRVYACPEASCARHDPARALGDLAGIRSHYRRRHGAEERKRKFKCDLCGKRYAADQDWAAHARVCAPREHRCGCECDCECGAAFSRRDGFLTHSAFAGRGRQNALTSALHRLAPPSQADGHGNAGGGFIRGPFERGHGRRVGCIAGACRRPELPPRGSLSWPVLEAATRAHAVANEHACERCREFLNADKANER